MEGFRALRPALATQMPNEVLSRPRDRHDPPATRPRKRTRHAAQEWAAVKKQILQLYAQYPLDRVIHMVEEQTGFTAGQVRRQYKNKLAEWGSEKYLRGTDTRFILAKGEERKSEGKSSTSFVVRGVQLDISYIEALELRYTSKAGRGHSSPLHPTPEGMEYYTPLYLSGSKNRSQATPQIFTPFSKVSSFAQALQEYMRSDPLIAMILAYDENIGLTKIIDVMRGSRAEAKKKRSLKREASTIQFSSDNHHQRQEKQEKQRQEKHRHLARLELEDHSGSDVKRHLHLAGQFMAVGNGRFSVADRLQAMLWKAHTLARFICNAVDASEERQLLSPVDLRPLASSSYEPHYFVVSQPEAYAPNDVTPLLRLLKTNEYVRQILGVTRTDYTHWMGDWSLIEEKHVAQALKSTADHLFGDIGASYPHSQSMSLLVRFVLHQPEGAPALLRFSFGQDTRSEYTDCRLCENMFILIESIGPSGALKVKVPLKSDVKEHVYRSSKGFETAHQLKSRTISSKWSTLAYQVQGFVLVEHYRRCFCNGLVHQNGFKKHYIDMATEKTARNDEWDPMSEHPEHEDTFESHPLEPDQDVIYVENEDDSDRESEDDHWDPAGAEMDTFDTFEPSPEEVETHSSYISKPHFFRVRG